MADAMDRRMVVRTLLADRGGMLVVSGLGGTCWDITAAGDSPLNFPLWGAMGGAVPLGLGLALAQPGRRVLVVTGDGEMLMGLGSLMTAGNQAPANLGVAVIDNGHFGETGGQRTHAGMGADLCAVAAAAGFRQAVKVTGENELGEAAHMLRTAPGPVFADIEVAMDKVPLVMPPKDGAWLKDRFRQALLGADAAI